MMTIESMDARSIEVQTEHAQSRGVQNVTMQERAGSLRITTRGRMVLAAALSLSIAAVMVVSTVAGDSANASLSSSTAPLDYVTVATGDSLWDVAVDIAPHEDPRDVIDQIVRINQLDSADVYAGQQLALPVAYGKP